MLDLYLNNSDSRTFDDSEFESVFVSSSHYKTERNLRHILLRLYISFNGSVPPNSNK